MHLKRYLFSWNLNHSTNFNPPRYPNFLNCLIRPRSPQYSNRSHYPIRPRHLNQNYHQWRL